MSFVKEPEEYFYFSPSVFIGRKKIRAIHTYFTSAIISNDFYS